MAPWTRKLILSPNMSYGVYNHAGWSSPLTVRRFSCYLALNGTHFDGICDFNPIFMTPVYFTYIYSNFGLFLSLAENSMDQDGGYNKQQIGSLTTDGEGELHKKKKPSQTSQKFVDRIIFHANSWPNNNWILNWLFLSLSLSSLSAVSLQKEMQTRM